MTGDPRPTAASGTAVEADEHVCSAKGCRAAAAHAVVWRNPRIHSAQRRKVWLACDEHRDSLSEFLDVRGFLIEVVPVDALTEHDG